MFDVDSWVYGKNKNWINRSEKQSHNSLPVVSGITVNNGVNYYTDDKVNIEDVFKDSLTISTRGQYSGTVTYHDGKFLLANNILVMKMDKLTKRQKLFIGSLIDNLRYGGYSGYPRKETLKNDMIRLPLKDNEIDFDFMESFVAELDAQRVAELDAYLTLTGLKNYELTDKEKYALEKYRSINWNDYNLYDLFDVRSYKKRFDANKININEKGKHPYVVRTAYNNGIRAYINEDERYLNPGNTISFGQDTATMWYQEKPYFTGDKIKILAPKFEEFKKENAHFIITAMSKPFQKFSWGASSFSEKVISSQKIKLPVDKNGEIDFNYMENLTQAIKKLVIKDVVKYSDRKLETTKEVLKYTR